MPTEIIDALLKKYDNECDENLSIPTEETPTKEFCLNPGKSQQQVFVCKNGPYNEGQVFKSQEKEKSRIEKVQENVLKIDSFTMNKIQQLTMQFIVQNNFGFQHSDLEYPLSICSFKKEEGDKKKQYTTMIFPLADEGPFDEWIVKNIDKTEQILNILSKIIEINNRLYEVCQFQHCDIKCGQVLLFNDEQENILPMLIDWDKSTLTLSINGVPIRIRLVKKEPFKINFTKKKKLAFLVVAGLSDAKRKIIGGLQYAERFKNMPLDSNKFYNV